MIKLQRTKDRVNSNGGQVLVGALLDRIAFGHSADAIRAGKRTRRGIANSECLRSYVGILMEGRTAFEEVEQYRGDDLFREVLGLRAVASAPTLRQRFVEANGDLDEAIGTDNRRLLADGGIGCLQTASGTFVPIDLDVSCMDNSRSRKEGVGRTYRGYDGFAPMFAYIGTEGYMLLNELRPGTQHCQNGTPDFLRQCLDTAEAVIRKPLLVRMDSGNDSVENLRIMHDRAAYVVKRNLRSESPDKWLETAKEHGTENNPRPGKTVWTGSIWTTFIDDDSMQTPVRQVFRVVERSVLADGTALLLPELEVEVWYTNLETETETQIIGLYCDHGTSEQYHSEFKGEIGLERLPCGDLAANKTVMLLGMVAYNLLRRIGADALNCGIRVPVRKEVRRRRIRKVIQDVIRLACKFVETSRSKIVRLASASPWTPVLERLYHAYT